jgi:hypothetical protein
MSASEEMAYASEVLVSCDARCEADAKTVYEGEAEGKSGEGYEEGLQFRNFRGVIDVEVSGGLGDGHGESDGKQRETVGVDGCRVADGLGGCVEFGASGTDEDEEDNHLREPPHLELPEG